MYFVIDTVGPVAGTARPHCPQPPRLQVHITIKAEARLQEFVEKCVTHQDEHMYDFRACAMNTTWRTHMAKFLTAHESGIASQTFADLRGNADTQRAG